MYPTAHSRADGATSPSVTRTASIQVRIPPALTDLTSEAELETWRHLGDPLADGVVEALDLKPGCDGLARIREHIDSLEPDQRDRRVVDFWTAVSSLPPDGVTALSAGRKPEPADFCPDAAIQRATRQPEPTLQEGQAVFTRYSAQIFTSRASTDAPIALTRQCCTSVSLPGSPVLVFCRRCTRPTTSPEHTATSRFGACSRRRSSSSTRAWSLRESS